MDIAQFRKDFPEFNDTGRYPDSQITFWSTTAEKLVLECVWKDMWQTAVKLWTAHEITLAAQNDKAANFGGVPGQQGGPINNKTVGTVTIGYDTATGSEKNAGYYNLTVYGKQFYRLMRLFGARCVQL